MKAGQDLKWWIRTKMEGRAGWKIRTKMEGREL